LTHAENKDDDEEEEGRRRRETVMMTMSLVDIIYGEDVQKHKFRSTAERNIELQPISLLSRNTFTMCHCKINTHKRIHRMQENEFCCIMLWQRSTIKFY
jgi:hypothetical protein